MRVVKNTFLAATLAANVLSGVSESYAHAMEAPTAADQIMQVMEVASSQKKSLPTPYATVDAPGTLLSTQDIIDMNGGLLIDTRLPESEWLANLAVVVANDHLGNMPIDGVNRFQLADQIAKMEGIVARTDSAREAKLLAREIGDGVIAQHLAHKGPNSTGMFANPMKGGRDNAFINTMFTSDTAQAKDNLNVQRNLIGKNMDYININGATNDITLDVVHHVTPEYQQQITPYWEAMWMVHELGHSHHEQGNLMIDKMIDATSAPIGMEGHLGIKGALEAHSDIQQLVVTQSVMAQNAESPGTLQALSDAMVRYRNADTAEWMNHYAKDISDDLGLTRNGNELNFKDTTAMGVEFSYRTSHQTEIALMATNALMQGNMADAANWNHLQQDAAVHALFEAYMAHPRVQEAFQDTSIIPFQEISTEQKVNIAQEVAQQAADSLGIDAPAPVDYPAPFNPSTATYMQSGFTPVGQQGTVLSGYHEGLMQLSDSARYPHLETAVVRPANVHDTNDVLLVPVAFPAEFSMARQAMELELGKPLEQAMIDLAAASGGVKGSIIDTPSPGAENSATTTAVLAIQAQTPQSLKAALANINALLGPDSALQYRGERELANTPFEPTLGTAKLFEHTHAAAFAIEDGDPANIQASVEELLYQTFPESQALFGDKLDHVREQHKQMEMARQAQEQDQKVEQRPQEKLTPSMAPSPNR